MFSSIRKWNVTNIRTNETMNSLDWNLINLETGRNMSKYRTVFVFTRSYSQTLISELDTMARTKTRVSVENNIEIDKLIWL